jgi:hypothetical protein
MIYFTEEWAQIESHIKVTPEVCSVANDLHFTITQRFKEIPREALLASILNPCFKSMSYFKSQSLRNMGKE